jgi:hypothetical protein
MPETRSLKGGSWGDESGGSTNPVFPRGRLRVEYRTRLLETEIVVGDAARFLPWRSSP